MQAPDMVPFRLLSELDTRTVDAIRERQEMRAELDALHAQVAALQSELARLTAIANEIHHDAFVPPAPVKRRPVLRIIRGGKHAAIGGGVALMIIGGLFLPKLARIIAPQSMTSAATILPGANPPEQQHHAPRRSGLPGPVRPPEDQPQPPGGWLDG
jgi:hypothetical protein